jgi:hypothetical protein
MRGIGKKKWGMNKFFALLGFLIVSKVLFGQYTSEGELTSRFRGGIMWFNTGLRPAEANKIRKYDRLIFDVTYNDWTGSQKLLQNEWSSIGLNTNIMFDIPLVSKNKIALGIGISHQFVSIRHDNHLIRDYELVTTSYVPQASKVESSKISFGGNSFSVPIELRFRNEGWKHLKFHVGGKIGYQATGYSRDVSYANGNREVAKRFGFPDLNELLYSIHVRTGFRNWALFLSYNFNTIFSNAASEQLNLVQAGLSISLY